ncbi:MAG: ABC transporter permease subunit [Actinomycetota bacterium]|nr:ABC transporter permease subunit [Actinomycetota bacterium]
MIVARRFALDRRRAFVWWAVGVAAMVASTVALWPSIRGQQDLDKLVQDLPEGLKALFGSGEGIAFTSAPGYLHSRLFSSLFPLLLLVFAIGLGARAVGGAEEDGTVELVLAHPVTRARVAAERYAAVVVLVGGLTLAGLLSLAVSAPLVDLLDGVSPARLAAAGVAVFALALLHASLAFAAGCAFGRRGPALAVASVVAVAGYLLQSLIAATDAADAARFVSPWHWYLERNLLAQHATLAATVLPVVLAAVVAVAGGWVFVRRDLRIP